MKIQKGANTDMIQAWIDPHHLPAIVSPPQHQPRPWDSPVIHHMMHMKIAGKRIWNGRSPTIFDV